MNLADLLADVVEQLPEDKRKVMDALVNEFEPGEDFRFLLALVAGASQRQRRMVRLLLNDLEKLEIEKEARKEG